MSPVLVRYVLMAAIRDRLIWGVAAMSIVGVCLSIFSGSAAINEQGQFIVSYMAGGLRIISLLGLTLFTIFFVRRSFDSRDIEFLLTRPVSRVSFVLSNMAAFSILSVSFGVFISAIIGGLALHYGAEASVMLWGFGVMLELVVITNTAFFFSMVLSSPVTAGMSTFGFYILARLMGQLLAILHTASHPQSIQDYVMHGLGYVVSLISVVIPRLDLMAQTSWLIYGGGHFSDWMFSAAQGLVFLMLISIATWFDLKRRQF